MTELGASQSSQLSLDLAGLRLNRGDRRLIDGLDILVKEGGRVGLTGPSGCGKTTLLRCVVSGRLNDESSAEKFKVTTRRIGYVPQRGGTLPWYSVERNFRLFGRFGSEEDGDWAARVLEMMELEEASGRFPAELSGGELQRARVGCAIAVIPGLICADEPLTEVGLEQKWRLLGRVSEEITRRRSSLLLVSHDIDTLLFLCDEIVVLGGANGSVARVTERFEVPLDRHPRQVGDLKAEEVYVVRERMMEALYLGQHRTP